MSSEAVVTDVATSEVDVVIIGAGIVGAAAAFRLTDAGFRVVVLERAVPNCAGSGTTAGNLHIQTIHTRRPGQGVALDVRRLLPLQLAASGLWDQLEHDVPGGVGLVRCGGYMVAETDEQCAALAQKHEWEREIGIPTRLLTGDEARQELPLLGPTVAGASWCALDGYAEPDIAGPALLAAALARGAQLFTDTKVTAIERIGESWNVGTAAGTWQAPHVVNAAGPWMAEVAAMVDVQLDLRALSLQMHTLAAPPETLNVLVQHVGEGISIKQDKRNRIVLGGGWPAGQFRAEGAAPIREESIEGNLAQTRRLMPGLGEIELSDVWTGPVVTTPDELPIIGELDSAPGVFVAGGTYSFTFASLWADILTAFVQGKEPVVDVSSFGPARLTASH